jgi:hypothetical protein
LSAIKVFHISKPFLFKTYVWSTCQYTKHSIQWHIFGGVHT